MLLVLWLLTLCLRMRNKRREKERTFNLVCRWQAIDVTAKWKFNVFFECNWNERKKAENCVRLCWFASHLSKDCFNDWKWKEKQTNFAFFKSFVHFYRKIYNVSTGVWYRHLGVSLHINLLNIKWRWIGILFHAPNKRLSNRCDFRFVFRFVV